MARCRLRRSRAARSSSTKKHVRRGHAERAVACVTSSNFACASKNFAWFIPSVCWDEFNWWITATDKRREGARTRRTRTHTNVTRTAAERLSRYVVEWSMIVQRKAFLPNETSFFCIKIKRFGEPRVWHSPNPVVYTHTLKYNVAAT